MKSLLPVFAIGLILAALVFAARCSQQKMHEYETRAPGGAENKIMNSSPNELAERERITAMFPDTLLSTTGIRYKILREGAGAKPIAGSRVRVHYTGRLLDGAQFDSSVPRNEPFEFTVLKNEVIRGWDQTLIDMRVGEKRLVVLPYRLGYGERGAPPDIPPRAALVFEIELLEIL